LWHGVKAGVFPAIVKLSRLLMAVQVRKGSIMTEKIKEILRQIRQDKPFVLTITNYFAMDLIANGIRSISAFPIMSDEKQEIEELINLSKSVVINIGRLNDHFIKLSHHVCRIANETNKPIILDPVGAGISRYRTDTAISFIKDHKISIVRGYPNELASLLDGKLTIPNIRMSDEVVIENGKKLSEKHNIAVVISGKFNTIIDANNLDRFNFDSALLEKIAGIDSLLSGIIGAFHAFEKDRFLAAQSAIAFYGDCVGSVTSRARGPASLKAQLIDQLFINSSLAVQW
jgi:hydroxyethylthiazole kinase